MNDILYPELNAFVIYNTTTHLYCVGCIPPKYKKKPKIYTEVRFLQSYVWQAIVKRSYIDNAYIVSPCLRGCIIYSLITRKLVLDVYEYISYNIEREKKRNPYFRDFAVIETDSEST